MTPKTDNTTKIILLDADVIIHFSFGDSLLLLKQIFPSYDKYVLDNVYTEVIRRQSSASTQLDFLISAKGISKVPMPSISSEIYKEYIRMKRDIPTLGDGEAACMAYARFNKNVLASSNFKDIVKYCQTHSIQYISTMDFLKEAMDKGIMTEEQCDKFIDCVRKAGSKLPCSYMFEYKEDRYKYL